MKKTATKSPSKESATPKKHKSIMGSLKYAIRLPYQKVVNTVAKPILTLSIQPTLNIYHKRILAGRD